jgi:nucleotide-binding universal stress UspA family protein
LTFSKILVPYDGSKYAERALNKVVNLAKMMKGSEIIILNIMEEIPVPPCVIYNKSSASQNRRKYDLINVF